MHRAVCRESHQLYFDCDVPKEPSTTSVPNNNCVGSILWVNFIHYSVIPAITIIVLLSFLEKRKDERMKSFFGLRHFAFIYPINLVDNQENRVAYALAFGATATLILDLFSGSFEYYYAATSSQPWVRILLGTIGTFEVGVDCYPMFACITSRNKLVGSIFGFLYTSTWFCFQLASVILCPVVKRGTSISYEPRLGEIPTLICIFFLDCKFAHDFVVTIKQRLSKSKITMVEKFMKTSEAIYVKNLFQKKKDKVEPQNKFETILFKYYDPVAGFVFPTRLICTFTVAIICQYQLAIVFFRNGLMALKRLFSTIEGSLEIVKVQFNWTDEQYEKAVELTRDYGVAAQVCWWVTSVLAIIITLMMVVHTCLCYRKHMLRMYKGSKLFLPRDTLSASESVTGNLQYCGFQIAYYLSGYAIMQGLVFFLSYLFTGGVVLPFIHFTSRVLHVFINTVIPTLIVLVLVFASQPILARTYFLQKRLDDGDWDKPLALQHREGFHNFSYFLVFLNVLVGVVAAVVRVMTSLLLGLFLVMRIDRPILMKGFEKLDQSYKAYVGNLQFLNAHSHPVMVSFCKILYYKTLLTRKQEKKRTYTRPVSTDFSDIPGLAAYETDIGELNWKNPLSKSVKRWHVAYTLIFNPKLIEMRKASSQLSYFRVEDFLANSEVTTLRRHRNEVLLRSKGFKRNEIDGILKTVRDKNLGPALMARLSRNLHEDIPSEEELESPEPSESSKYFSSLFGLTLLKIEEDGS
ncbi:putative stimulated by retinoic acid protein 6 protein-like [Apostichopus japonicus]|uniref:Putative stimulated by retinoic acid protein 6 protein-like n=1 Tax=Stichopus japonicus TaxID=307972 RepID=A0A2G8KHB6_STIJA|nr:putative stimulated by retinoic acid protein 6 protein-like [Apostichopus japonicus]